jgi:aryl-alcohol dehydrogenase (NADP+)
MEYVRLGSTGLKVSRICLGTMTYGDPGWRPWVLAADESLPFYRRASELGINFWDTADMYSVGASEEVTGKAIKEFGNRDQLVIATKVFNAMSDLPNDRGLSRKHILQACDDSLRRLGTDYIDLYQIHRFDYETPIEETCDALNRLVEAGKVRYLGASSMYSWQFMKMLAVQDQCGYSRFVTMQPQYNLVYREEEREMLPLCKSEGIGVIPWSPLARGYLTKPASESTTRSETDQYSAMLYTSSNDRQVADRVQELAARKQVSAAQVALAWVLQNPVVTAPIVGATKMKHLDDAVAALDLELSCDDIQFLEELYIPHPVKDHA